MKNTARKSFPSLLGILAVLFAAVMFTACGDCKTNFAEPPAKLVLDFADAFSPEEEQMLTAAVEQFERTSGGQLRILTVQTTDGIPIEAFSIRVATDWNIGSIGNGNGVLMTLAVKDHVDRIEVGRSWESTLTDTRCGEVLRAIMPELREGQYADACAKAVRSLEAFFQ